MSWLKNKKHACLFAFCTPQGPAFRKKQKQKELFVFAKKTRKDRPQSCHVCPNAIRHITQNLVTVSEQQRADGGAVGSCRRSRQCLVSARRPISLSQHHDDASGETTSSYINGINICVNKSVFPFESFFFSQATISERLVSFLLLVLHVSLPAFCNSAAAAA